MLSGDGVVIGLSRNVEGLQGSPARDDALLSKRSEYGGVIGILVSSVIDY